MEFSGKGTPLTDDGFGDVADTLGVGAPEVWAILSVETRGAGFLPDRRPLILFERHIFSRRTGGRFDASNPDVSNPQAGGYGPGGANQYGRLQQAIALDRTAALESASWGIAQVMGFHATDLGYSDVAAMVTAMVADETAQLMAMARFIARNRACRRALVAHDWPSFARCYNGAGYARNKYDVRLQQQYERWSAGPLPDLVVRAAQAYLTYRRYAPGPVDGLMGRFTRQAIEAFQQEAGLPVTGEPDDATMQQLAA